jgi:hypothetical protein
MLISLSK